MTSFLVEKERHIKSLNLKDPDYIPLHYLISKDIIKEFEAFKREKLPLLKDCNTIFFSEFINNFDIQFLLIQTKNDSLALLNNNVYLIFYEKALFEYRLRNEDEGEYMLFRSLQYNPLFPDAILLKLKKLLQVNNFSDCLSLLNTLYYKTKLDRRQEMLAIEFTDIFYQKLYNTGDSLVKLERAADALEIFEILETFCLNLPTSYCNDDYYHGILSSKSGIYESYLRIAQVAKNRGNNSIAEHFYQYAKDYLEENKESNFLERNVEIQNEVIPFYVEYSEIPVVIQPNQINTVKETVEKVLETTLTPKELKVKYDDTVFQALALCIKEDFSASYKLFLEAQELEECQCFEKDFRVSLMLNELKKIIR
jgi:predicted nucleic-acid-binding protein